MRKITYILIILCYLLSGKIYSQWQQVFFNELPHLETHENAIFAATGLNGLYLSTNNGSNWLQTSLNNVSIISMTSFGNNIFAGSNITGVYLSTNSGLNWNQTSLNNRQIHALTTSGNSIFAGTEDYGIYISTNNGMNWTQTSLNNRDVHSFLVSGNDIFAGTGLNGVYKSTNNGLNWVQTSFNTRTVYDMVSFGNTIVAGTAVYGVYRSTNNGVNWTQMAFNNKTIYRLEISGNSIFAAAENGLYLSTDYGLTWVQRNEGFNYGIFYSVNALNGYLFIGATVNGSNHGGFKRPLSEFTGVSLVPSEIPNSYLLLQNYPNPFNPVTNIEFQIPKSSNVKLAVYDMTGKELEVLINKNLSAGIYRYDWDASKYSSGVFFYTITAGDFTETRKMILIK